MLLLDTHTYLWFVNGDRSLPSAVSDRIQTSEKVFVSIASFWEMAIKGDQAQSWKTGPAGYC